MNSGMSLAAAAGGQPGAQNLQLPSGHDHLPAQSNVQVPSRGFHVPLRMMDTDTWTRSMVDTTGNAAADMQMQTCHMLWMMGLIGKCENARLSKVLYIPCDIQTEQPAPPC